MPPAFLFQRGCGSLGASTDETYFLADRLFNWLQFPDQRVKGIMRTSGETDFRFRLKLKITLVESTYPSQRPECPSLSPHFLLAVMKCFESSTVERIEENWNDVSRCLYDNAK